MCIYLHVLVSPRESPWNEHQEIVAKLGADHAFFADHWNLNLS